MSQTLRKRGFELETLADYNDVGEPKRFEGEETDRFLDLLQLDQTLADEEEESSHSEELVRGVMRSLEEEIAAPYSTSCLPSSYGDILAASNICRDHEGKTLDSKLEIDLSYLVDASDYELGIPPSTTFDLKDEVRPDQKEIYEGLMENPDLKYLGENFHFEDDFENYQQFALYEESSQQFALYEDARNESQVPDYLT